MEHKPSGTKSRSALKQELGHGLDNAVSESFAPGSMFNPTEISTCSGPKNWCGYVLACSTRAWRYGCFVHTAISIAACCKACNIVAFFPML